MCDPDPHRGYRSIFWLSVGAINIAAVALFGYATGATFESIHGVAAALLAALTWPAIALVARVASPLPAAALIGQTAMVISNAALAAAPFLLAALLVPEVVGGVLVALAVGAGLARLLAGARYRLALGSARKDSSGR